MDTSEPKPWQIPWNVPVPVAPSTFTPLRARHARFNVQTDLGAVQPFAYSLKRRPRAQLLYADLQTNAGANVNELRLGSGRSGFLAGKYLKGIGRTLLAGNWASVRDRYHATGHLQPSAAIREHLISRYLIDKGLGHTINPCEGLLISRAPARALMENVFSRAQRRRTPLPACDVSLTAITVKGGGFARHSNYVWLLNHFYPADHTLPAVFMSLCHFLRRGAPGLAAPDCTPAAVVQALDDSFAAGVRNFRCFLDVGLYWGSFSNNFTLDGRFLDLEVPTLLGRPFFGVLRSAPDLPLDFSFNGQGSIVGCEVLLYLGQMASFIRYLRARAQWLITEFYSSGPAYHFLSEFIACLDRTFDQDHPLFNGQRREDLVVDMLGTALDLSSEERTFTRNFIRPYRLRGEARREAGARTVRLEPVDVVLPRTEPASRHTAYRFQALGAERCRPAEDALVLHECLERIERATDPDDFLAEVQDAEQRLARIVRRPPVATAPAPIQPPATLAA